MIVKGILLVYIVINVICVVKIEKEKNELTKKNKELIETNERLIYKVNLFRNKIKELVYDEYKNMVVSISDEKGMTTDILIEGASYFTKEGSSGAYKIYDAADKMIATFPASRVMYIIKVKDDAKDDVDEKNCQA